jgi:prephenate dehydrogenase
MKGNKNRKIAIIGWKTSWGNFCLRHLSRYSEHKLLLRDKDSGPSLEHISQNADIIIVAVPLPLMVKTIRQLGSLRPEQLIIDFASRKSGTMKAMLKTKAQVLGLHPLAAAPLKKKKLHGCTIVACPGRLLDHGYGQWVECFLKSTKANIVWRTSEEHDLAMLGHQNIVFEMMLAYAIAIRKLGVPVHNIVGLRTKLSRKPLAAMARMLLNGTPIYADILQHEGKGCERVQHVFGESVEEVFELINRDKEYVLACMAELRMHFGDDVLKKLVKGEF